jgi:spore germination protein GerM
MRIALILLVALLATGCGGGARTVSVVFFSGSDEPVTVRRNVAAPIERNTLLALLRGPTPAERRHGVATTLPSDTRLVALSVHGTTATVALRSASAFRNLNPVDLVRRLDQVVFTLTALPQLDRVTLRMNGEPWGLWSMRGGVIDSYTRGSLATVCHGHIWVGPPPC